MYAIIKVMQISIVDEKAEVRKTHISNFINRALVKKKKKGEKLKQRTWDKDVVGRSMRFLQLCPHPNS